MKTTPFILALLLLAGMATTAWAQNAGFYGYVTFRDCQCNGWSQVAIYHVETDETFYCYIRCGGNPGYNTSSTYPYYYPPGTYRLSVVSDPQHSACNVSPVQIVTHGTQWQEVNLEVYGNSGTPTGPQGP